MNCVQLLGRLVKDPESKDTTNSTVTNFTLAVNRQYKKEGQPECDFINCVSWGNTAKFIANYFAKGRQVAVSGKLQVRSWDDQEGKKRYATEVIVDSAFFADSKQSGNDIDTVNLPIESLIDGELPF